MGEQQIKAMPASKNIVSFSSYDYNSIMFHVARRSGLNEIDCAYQNKKILLDMACINRIEQMLDYCVITCKFKAHKHKKKRKLVPTECVHSCIIVDNGGKCMFDDAEGYFDETWTKLFEQVVKNKLSG